MRSRLRQGLVFGVCHRSTSRASGRGFDLGCLEIGAPYLLGFGVPYFNTFFLKEPLWNKSLYFFLPGYLKAQFRGRYYKSSAPFMTVSCLLQLPYTACT